jgi:hypothetical protein
MSRPIGELIRDYESDPTPWEVIRIESEPSTNRRNRGGTSVQELLRHKVTGEEMVRHTLIRPDGTPFDDPHFRLDWR